MVARKILTWPNPGLRKISSDVNEFDDNLSSLISDMQDTLAVNYGAGLAAPQIGVHQRVVIIKCSSFGHVNPLPRFEDDDHWIIVNPKLECAGTKRQWKEACLSVPGHEARVDRWPDVEMSYQDTKGNKHQFTAVWPMAGAIQHECDHLDGRLFLHHLSWYSRQSIEKRIRKKRKREVELRAAAEAERKRELDEVYGNAPAKNEYTSNPMRKKRAKIAKQSRKRNRKKK